MYLYGASGHAKVILEILESIGIEINGLFDDNEKITELLGYKCNKPDIELINCSELLISIGDNKTRKKIAGNYSKAKYTKAIDITSKISKRSIIGNGTVIMPGVIVNSSCYIGNHIILNTKASIDHDCIIEDFVHIGPGATLCGGVKVHEGTFIGAGAVILPGIKIGKWSIIGAGSIVNRNIPDHQTWVGNPAKRLK
ncbi:MAG: acetyltransferase [Bacteroidetes bacterium GWC2_33_15]|nr:MAG: acetyltransferase [Bacteroidetes bacterium GWA2_33_15]OFX52189.1 MAG: acetyltransferase [Bacteroidetes bacterium GWC2_33_15]OFX64343.1 MAG: acetyltransferase [Bacteroidetes bacterium GWB2_32_14]OFX67748.1 MAG: acetyltransferase [Bacteroidetes bacterium GWD2_33_33]HAN19360.1 acetyltransferase [Bacteroidales bacterium]